MRNKIKSVSVLYAAMFVAFCACNDSQQAADRMVQQEVAPDPVLLYGYPVDSFQIESSNVGKNEYLSHIFQKIGLSQWQNMQAAAKIDSVYGVRRIHVGNGYSVFYTMKDDSSRQVSHFVYDIDPVSYLVCDFGDDVAVRLEKKTVRELESSGGATITTSLWNAVSDNNMKPTLALELSDIYAWTIDFFGIEKGDNFKVIYTERYVDSTSIGMGEVKAAVFEHHGHKQYAFRYEKDSVASYYDMEGNSLRKAFLKAPLKFSRISSRFSSGRLHPVLKIRRPHHGVDYAAASGTPVMSIGDGVVIAKGWDAKGGGNYIKVRHNSVYTTVYMHLRGFAKGIVQGGRVSQGDVIGYVGATGLATGPHLDFRVYKDGSAIDPLKMEAPSVEPVSNDDMEDFINYSDSLKRLLDAIEL